MEFLKKKTVQWAIFGIVVVAAGIRAFSGISEGSRQTGGYDEQMWTSSSVTSYYMFAKGYIRPTKGVDHWFPSYAYKHGLPVFEKNIGELQGADGKPRPSDKIIWDGVTPQDSIIFPYDMISFDTLNQKVGMIVKFDTTAFPRSEFQWFDVDIWTFGWKAPNFGKYIMGWWIDNFGPEKPNPQGYFNNRLPVNHPGLKSSKPDEYDSTTYKASSVPTSTSFSFAPPEMVVAARQPNALFTVLIVAIVFLLGWHVFNFYTGLAGSLWLLLNSTFFMVNTAVGLDSFSTFFTTVSVFLLILLIQSFRKDFVWWKSLLLALASALNIGFAISSKLNSAMLVYINVIVFTLAGLFYLWELYKTRSRTSLVKLGILIACGAISGLLSVGTFLQLNPQMQGNTRIKVAVMRESIDDYFTERIPKMLNDVQQRGKKSYDWSKVKGNFGKSFSIVAKRMAVVNYEPENYDKNYYGTFGALLPFQFNFLDGLFALVGMVSLVLAALKGMYKEKALPMVAVFVISAFAIFYGNIDFLWQDWARYFTPMFPLYALFVGYGLFALVNFAFTKRKKETKPPKVKS